MADSRVVATAVDRLFVPQELAEQVAGTVGPDGAALLPALRGEVRWVRVDSPKFGTQIIRTLGAATTPASVVRLEPVGGVSGRVVAENDQPVKALRIHAETMFGRIRPGGYSRVSHGHDRCQWSI